MFHLMALLQVQNPVDLTGLLALLVGGGAAAWILSPLLEKWEWFRSQETQLKVLIVGILNVAITAGALWVVQNIPSTTIESLNPIAAALLNAFYLVINQLSYARVKNSQAVK